MDATYPTGKTSNAQPETHETVEIVGIDGGTEYGFAYILRGACGPCSVLERCERGLRIVDAYHTEAFQGTRDKLHEVMPEYTNRPIEFLVGEIIRRATSDEEKARMIVRVFREAGFTQNAAESPPKRHIPWSCPVTTAACDRGCDIACQLASAPKVGDPHG